MLLVCNGKNTKMGIWRKRSTDFSSSIFLYEVSDLWYVEYEAGAEVLGDVESQPLNLRGFATVEEAKKAAEDYSEDLDEPLDLELPEEE